MGEPCTKIRRLLVSKRSRVVADPLNEVCRRQDWEAATERALSKPEEAIPEAANEASPLALACRFGAPLSCISAILCAAPDQLRRLLPSRGTPLHEAIVCESIGVDVIELLLSRDEELPGTRATLKQDVDGHTPLHVLIRRRSAAHVLEGNDSHWKQLLELLVKSCPQAVAVPDKGEFEEPPIVMALKASLYAGADYELDDYARIERAIYDMVKTMLQYCPDAATQVLTGARGNYTAIHSAVFHGRCSDTIQLLLEAKPDRAAPLLLANTQGELPLHFATMRGESPRSITLLAEAAPKAILTRDVSGLTPLHWLWIRFVSSLMVLDEKGGDETLLEFDRPTVMPCHYTAFWVLEKGEFYADLNLLRRVDPPVDFLRMRHIPPEIWGSNAHVLAERAVEVLLEVKERRLEQSLEDGGELQRISLDWTRLEAVTSLFWTKVVSLLRVTATSLADGCHENFNLLHTAMTTSACPPQVARLACLNFSRELSKRDHRGRLPLHYAACRKWHAWDWRPAQCSESAACHLLRGESSSLLQFALDLSPPGATIIADNDGKLPLHHAIDTFVAGCATRILDRSIVQMMLDLIVTMLRLSPNSLERRDAETMLYPFQQAAVVATQHENAAPIDTNFSVASLNASALSIVYLLLRENPTILMRFTQT